MWYILFKTNLSKRSSSALWTGDKQCEFLTLFLQKSENQMQAQLSEASWRYVKVLGGFGFQKLINELSLSPYADFL